MPDYKEDKIIVLRFEEANGFYTTRERSLIMSKIKGRNTKPELMFRKALWSVGVKYRIRNNDLPGNPDVAIRKYKLAIFIDGEFWHGYNWESKKITIKSNAAFWIPKIERNMQRDKINNQKLEGLGYKVFRFWGNDVKKNLGIYIADILLYIKEREAGAPLSTH